MPVPRQFFTVTGNTTVKLRLTASYTAIASDLGLTAVTASDPGQPISSGQAISMRLGSRIRITYSTGSKKRSSALVFCAADKEDTALQNLTGKTYGTYTIVSCGYPRRAIMY